ncbi:MAG: hypothetical protein WCH61_01245 [bacterium]
MKWYFKLTLWLAGVVGMLVFAGLLFMMLFLGPLVKNNLERLARERLNGELTITSLRVNPFNASFTVTGLRVKNPPGFAREDLFSMPFLMADLDLRDSLLHRRYHFSRLILNVESFDFERRPDGVSNLDGWLAAAKAEKAGRHAPPPAKTGRPSAAAPAVPRNQSATAAKTPTPSAVTPPAAPVPAQSSPANEPPELIVDRLTLTLGQLHVKDATNAALGEMNLDLAITDRELLRLKGRDQIATALMAEVLPALMSAQTRAIFQKQSAVGAPIP